jgi:large subunit ribosomal protein L10
VHQARESEHPEHVSGVSLTEVETLQPQRGEEGLGALARLFLLHMAKTREQKGVIIDSLAESFKNSASTVFVHFRGVNVADETTMRRALRGDNVKYTVAKKTFIKRALTSLGHDHATMPLDGEVAVAYGGGDDATAAARLIHEFGKKFADKIQILGGIFEGALKGKEEMTTIATIPSMQALRGMFAQVINSPRTRFAVVLSKVAETKSA